MPIQLEQAIYESAGIDVDLSDAVRDDSATLTLIMGKANGILRLLDEQNLLKANGSDRSFVANLERVHGADSVAHKKNSAEKDGAASTGSRVLPSARYSKPRTRPEHFIIHHFAGSVMYDSAGLVEKNADLLSIGCLRLLASAGSSVASGDGSDRDTVSLIAEHFSSLLPTGRASTKKHSKTTGLPVPRDKQQNQTVAKRFLEQLDDLLVSLRASQNHCE